MRPPPPRSKTSCACVLNDVRVYYERKTATCDPFHFLAKEDGDGAFSFSWDSATVSLVSPTTADQCVCVYWSRRQRRWVSDVAPHARQREQTPEGMAICPYAPDKRRWRLARENIISSYVFVCMTRSEFVCLHVRQASPLGTTVNNNYS